TPEAKPPPAPTQYEFGTCSERDPMVNSSPPSTSRLIAIASTGAGSHSTSSAPGTVPTSPAGTTFAARPQSRSARTTVRFSSAATIPHTLVTRIPSTGPSAITRNGEDSSAKPIPVVRTETAPARTASAARARGHHCGSVTRATVRGRRSGAEAARVLERGRRGCDGVWRHEMAYTPGPAAIDPPTTGGHRAARAERCRRREAGSTEAVPRSERVPCDPADPAVAPLFTGSPAVLLLSRTHEAGEDAAPDQAAVRPVRCAPHTEEKEGPRMDSRHDVTVGHELQAAAETGQIPVVPATADAGDHAPTWRSTLAVTISLVVTFAAVALVSL